MNTYAVLIFIAGIVAMDTTSGPQVLISEPIVSCSLLGFLFGIPETGLTMGALFQLLWLGYMPLGAARLTDGNMGAYISTAGLFTAGRIFGLHDDIMKAVVIPAMLYSIIVGYIGLRVTQSIRKLNGIRNDKMRQVLETGEEVSIKWYHVKGIGSSLVRGMIMGVILIPLGACLFGIITVLPLQVIHALMRSSFLIWGAVFASGIIFFWNRGIERYFLIGSIGGILWILFLLLGKG